MTNNTDEQAREQNIASMGESLGTQYSLLWQELAALHLNWKEFIELFATNPERIEILNATAANFFGRLQSTLWEDVLLHIARLTDPPMVSGKENLTIQNLNALVDKALQPKLTTLIDEAIAKSKFCRDWRNRHIAHRDLAHSLDTKSSPLASATRAQVDDVLKALVSVMNSVAAHYQNSETAYSFIAPIHGAVSMLYILRDGLERQNEREKHLLAGAWQEVDRQKPI